MTSSLDQLRTSLGNHITYVLDTILRDIDVFETDHPDAEQAFELITALGVAQSQPPAVQHLVRLAPTLLDQPSPMSPAGRVLAWLERLAPSMDALVSQVWALAAPHLPMRECSLTGSVNTPALASFVGGAPAQLTIVFKTGP